MENLHVVIIGVGRSGTSLLQSMLAMHPQINMLPETSTLRRHHLSVRWRLFWRPIVGKSLSADTRVGRLKNWNKSLHLNYVSSERFDELLPNGITADKDPKLIEKVSLIHNFVNKPVKYIRISRSGCDVIYSKLNADWSKRRGWIFHCLVGCIQNKLFDLQKNKIDYLECDYLNLITDPDKELKKICKYLQIDFDQNMTRFSQAASRLVSDDEYSWKKELFGGIIKNNTRKWQYQFNPIQINIIRRVHDRVLSDTITEIDLVSKVIVLGISEIITLLGHSYAISHYLLYKAIFWTSSKN